MYLFKNVVDYLMLHLLVLHTYHFHIGILSCATNLNTHSPLPAFCVRLDLSPLIHSICLNQSLRNDPICPSSSFSHSAFMAAGKQTA